MLLDIHMDEVRSVLDPIIRTLLILLAPLLMDYILYRLLAPIARSYRRIHFTRLPRIFISKSKHTASSKWVKHIAMLIRSVSQHTIEKSEEELVQRFLLQTGSVFITAYVGYGLWMGLINGSILFGGNWLDRWAISLAVMASTLPYIRMRLQLHRIRVKNSYDLVPAVQLLLAKYGEFRGNLYYATYETTKGLEGDILNAFVSLLPSLQGSSDATIEEAIELFNYRIGTTWAIQLGILFHKSESQGDNVEQGLRWLISDMSEVAKITEEIKSENRESIQMAYMPAFLLPAVIYLNQYPSMGKSWYYYFQTTVGMRMIIFTLLFTVICAFTAYMIQKPRNEV